MDSGTFYNDSGRGISSWTRVETLNLQIYTRGLVEFFPVQENCSQRGSELTSEQTER